MGQLLRLHAANASVPYLTPGQGTMEKAVHPTPVLLPRKSRGWRSLVGCSPWGHTELDTTDVT